MNNQKNKNEEIIDFTKFQAGQKKEPFTEHKDFGFENLKKFWQRTGKKNQIYTTIIPTFLILIIIFLISLFVGKGGKEAGPAPNVPQYAPPAEYSPLPGEKYAPPFP